MLASLLILSGSVNQAQAVSSNKLAPALEAPPYPIEAPLVVPEINRSDYRRENYEKYLEQQSDDPRVIKLAKEIISREGQWDYDVCNLTYGCSGGQGLFQVIPDTEVGCEKVFGREMDMLNPYDNIDCGMHLLTVNGVYSGIGHWDDMSWKKGLPKEWGSGPYQLLLFGF